MKKTTITKRILSLILALAACLSIFTMSFGTASAASYTEGAYVPGFPLGYKASGYNVTVLGRYSDGTTHPSYLYNRNYGPLKKHTLDSNTLLDIDTATGAKVYAVQDGTIVTNKKGSYDDYYVVVKHADNTYAYYGHLVSTGAWKNGNTIKAGDLVGKISKQSHLHFEWSGHDPYCQYAMQGLLHTYKNKCGAKVYPHTHGAYVALDAAGGTTQTNHMILAKKATSYGSLPTPVRPGYRFSGWYTSANGGTKVTSSTAPAATNHTLYARWAKCSSHKYSGGLCQYCGNEWAYTVKALKPTAYKVTKSDSAPIWSRPYSNYSVKTGRMAKGAIVTVIAQTDNQAGNRWYLLSTGDWIFSGNVAKVSMPSGTRYVKGTDGTLNMRATANGKLVGSIPEGAAVIANTSKTSGSWIWVTYNGVSGYVSSKYLTTTAPTYNG